MFFSFFWKTILTPQTCTVSNLSYWNKQQNNMRRFSYLLVLYWSELLGALLLLWVFFPSIYCWWITRLSRRLVFYSHSAKNVALGDLTNDWIIVENILQTYCFCCTYYFKEYFVFAIIVCCVGNLVKWKKKQFKLAKIYIRPCAHYSINVSHVIFVNQHKYIHIFF